MKRIFTKASTIIITLALAISISLGVCIGASAEELTQEPTALDSGDILTEAPEDKEESGEISTNTVEDSEDSGDLSQNTLPESSESGENIFDEFYKKAEENADKIFAILAFIGTLIVSIGYKSGLLPMLRDALSRLKFSIDGVKDVGEMTKNMTEKSLSNLSLAVEEIDREICENSLKLSQIELDVREIEKMKCEREAMRLILSSQIDMLYAIFMSSALPQYQKDEIGEHIAKMREELKSYEQGEVC